MIQQAEHIAFEILESTCQQTMQINTQLLDSCLLLAIRQAPILILVQMLQILMTLLTVKELDLKTQILKSFLAILTVILTLT